MVVCRVEPCKVEERPRGHLKDPGPLLTNKRKENRWGPLVVGTGWMGLGARRTYIGCWSSNICVSLVTTFLLLLAPSFLATSSLPELGVLSSRPSLAYDLMSEKERYR